MMKQIDDDFIRTLLEYIGSGRIGAYREVATLLARLQSLPELPVSEVAKPAAPAAAAPVAVAPSAAGPRRRAA
jgi:hypothetical protein